MLIVPNSPLTGLDQFPQSLPHPPPARHSQRCGRARTLRALAGGLRSGPAGLKNGAQPGEALEVALAFRRGADKAVQRRPEGDRLVDLRGGARV